VTGRSSSSLNNRIASARSKNASAQKCFSPSVRPGAYSLGLRTAISKGFHLDNLHHITRLGHALLNSDKPLRHPSAAYLIAVTAQKIAWYCEGYPVRDETISVIEAHIKPKMEAVLDAADENPESLIQALDELARAYADATPFLKSIGT
jgi:hypothetical protein